VMSRIFDHFPDAAICPVCKTSEDHPAVFGRAGWNAGGQQRTGNPSPRPMPSGAKLAA